MSKNKFILRQLAIASLPFLLIATTFIAVDMLIFKESFLQALKSSALFIGLGLPILEIYHLYSINKRAKKIGMDIWKNENRQGDLFHRINVPGTKDEVSERLNNGNWKYKILDNKTVGDKTILLVRHYQIPSESALFIELSETKNSTVDVLFKTKGQKKRFFNLVFTTWSFKLKQIEYFQNILLDNEELNAQLSFID